MRQEEEEKIRARVKVEWLNRKAKAYQNKEGKTIPSEPWQEIEDILLRAGEDLAVATVDICQQLESKGKKKNEFF